MGSPDRGTGLFSVQLPDVGWGEWTALLAGAFSVVFVGYSETLGSGRAVIDADAISLTDTDGADTVAQIAEELRSQGIELALARVQPAILDLWTRAGAIDAVGEDRVFDTVRQAVAACLGRPRHEMDA
jgi:MFS superfamily sulfate permease-like transporter